MEQERQSDLPFSVFSNSLQLKMFNIPRCHILGQQVLDPIRVSQPSFCCYLIIECLENPFQLLYNAQICQVLFQHILTCSQLQLVKMSVWPNTLTSIRKDGFFTEGRPPNFNMLTCIENLLKGDINISSILSSTFLPHFIISKVRCFSWTEASSSGCWSSSS